MTRPYALDVDLLAPELHASGEILAVFRRLRAEAPVAWMPGRHGPGSWAITGHPELVAAARDPGAFSSYWGTRPEALRPAGAARPLHNLDPPDHAPLRALAARTLSPARLAAVERAITALVRTTLAGLAARGDADAVTELAEPLVARVFAAWLGMPDHLAPALLERVTGVHAAGAALLDTPRRAPGRAAREAEARDAARAITALMEAALAGAAPDSVLGELRRGGAAGLSLAILFVEAGLPTLVDALTGAIADVLAHPDRRALARAAATDGGGALIDELLRRASPIAQFARRARHPVELGGRRIAAGEQVVLWFVSANLDERVFRDPERLDPARAPNPHVALGVGPHRCIGGALAERVLRAVLPAFLEPAFELVGPGERRRSSYQRGFSQLRVRRAAPP